MEISEYNKAYLRARHKANQAKFYAPPEITPLLFIDIRDNAIELWRLGISPENLNGQRLQQQCREIFENTFDPK